MLRDAPVSAILPAVNMARAKDFYQNKLGLELRKSPADDPMMFEAGEDTVLVVYHRDEPTSAEHTVAGFLVEDLDDAIRGLEANGIVFEDYDLPGLHTTGHVMDYGFGKSAWFKDTEGNILALNQMNI